jgi:hypothetical protein
MAYLYGDSTPFPLNENYIDTTRDAVELCTTLLQIDRTLEQLRQQTRDERESAESTLAEFKKLASEMAAALQPYATGADIPTVKDVSAQLVKTVHGVLDHAQSSLVARRDGNINQAHQKMLQERTLALPALERFLLRHEPKGTVWSLFYRMDELQAVVARATAQTPFGLRATFELKLPPTSPWTKPVRVIDLRQNIAVNLPKKSRRRTTKRKIELDRYNITEVRLADDSSILMRRALKASSPALTFTWSGDGITVVSLEDGTTPSPPVEVDEYDAVGLTELRKDVESQLRLFVRHRVQLAEAAFNDKPVAEMDTPVPLARQIIHTVAPYVREIRNRSPVEGELTLKRQVEDGRREEVFVAVSELVKIYASLPPDRRAFFDEFGLEGGVVEIAAGEPTTDSLGGPEESIEFGPEDSGTMELSPEDSAVVELGPADLRPRDVGIPTHDEDTELDEEIPDEPPTIQAKVVVDEVLTRERADLGLDDDDQ